MLTKDILLNFMKSALKSEKDNDLGTNITLILSVIILLGYAIILI